MTSYKKIRVPFPNIDSYFSFPLNPVTNTIFHARNTVSPSTNQCWGVIETSIPIPFHQPSYSGLHGPELFLKLGNFVVFSSQISLQIHQKIIRINWHGCLDTPKSGKDSFLTMKQFLKIFLFRILALSTKVETATVSLVRLAHASLTTLGKFGWVNHIGWNRKGRGNLTSWLLFRHSNIGQW